MDIESVISLMMVEEKAALVSGTNSMYTNPIPRLGVPGLCMADGPHGLRHQKSSGEFGATRSEPATAFPTAACTACGWDPENLRKMGEAIGEECRHYGVHTLLGPGVNIKRNPLCGRNFEYFSEDPLLAGSMAAAMVEGVQSRGVGVSVKHFAMNNTENNRMMGNSVVSEKTMRRIYLKPFEQVVRQAKPATMMCAYNRINGVYCSDNKWLLTDVLRGEWGFDGVVMSDWGAVHDRVAGLMAGLDLEMPGDTAICRRRILDAVADGSLPMEVLDEACRRILRWVDKYVLPESGEPVDWEAHHALAGEIAADCAVLMKNDGTLPLSGSEKLHITGPLFETMRFQGAGSSMINPTKVTTPKDAFNARGIASVPLEESDTVLVFAGLTDGYETEGRDRTDMRLPEDQLRLIDDLSYSGKKIVVVLFGGSPVELPFTDSVSAILNMYLPGQNGGEAVCKLLFGEKNPSGRLAETWPLRYEDVPGASAYGKQPLEVYAEGCEVGYRYYDRNGVPVRFPFGFGLSYTTFESSEWSKDGDTYTRTVTNTGERAGAEVVQLYLNGELAGFRKVYLEPGETKTVSVTVDPTPEPDWSDEYEVPAEEARLPITLESRFTDLKLTFFGRKIYKAVSKRADKQARQAEKLPDGPEKENKRKAARFMRCVIESSSLRSMAMSAGKKLPYNYAEAFVEIANGRLLKGIGRFLKKVDVPTLPKDK
ncbi:MAG: glycoside hydrolase family 3 C-terminal domain-containing protein [Oscillospiraceae bacterium]|nr:glycoside hydrolase family 3 C-terminal domain-containing protein [Oscillospiraceae bacterium]